MSLSPALQVLNALSKSLLSEPAEDFLQQVAAKAAELLSASVGVVWKFDKQWGKLRVVAATGNVDEEFKEVELDVNAPGVTKLLSRGKTGYLEDVRSSPSNYYRHQKVATQHGWVSLLSAPMWANDELIGVLDVYTDSVRVFTPLERELFDTFAYQAAAAIQKAELYREAVTARRKLQDLNYEIAIANNRGEMLRVLLNGTLGLVKSLRGWISLLNPLTGGLELAAQRGNPRHFGTLKIGEGISGFSLQHERLINAGDVREAEWQHVYVEHWPDVRSVLSVPILVIGAKACVGSGIELMTRPIGVLNIESPEVNAFSDKDAESIWSLACLAAIKVDKLDFDRKLSELRSVETEIVGNRSYDETVKILMRGITETLGYDYVNISLVVPEINRIRTEYITGIPEENVEELKRISVISLDSKDIQADIVRNKRIEVPAKDDQRFDRVIFEKFAHRDFVRVFLPMIVPSDGRVIGTVEAGYTTPGYRKHIYEQDVQILQGFINYAVQALNQRDKRLLETVSHEFRAPLIGLRNNIEFLKRRRPTLTDELVEKKFTDMALDCQILLQQVETLEYFLGRPSPMSHPEVTIVVRDIIIKTVNQLQPLVAERGFDQSRIQVRDSDIRKVRLYIDRPKLSQVFYNLLINSIKYADPDPQLFTILIRVGEHRDSYTINIKDWGIGVEPGMEELIFEQGFRTPRAMSMHLTGSGLGLALARMIMREMGGDLKLINRYKPTDFQVMLPKSLRERPNDPFRG